MTSQPTSRANDFICQIFNNYTTLSEQSVDARIKCYGKVTLPVGTEIYVYAGAANGNRMDPAFDQLKSPEGAI